MKNQYIVAEKDKIERGKFYDYISNKYNLKMSYPYAKEKFIASNFPFVVDFKENTFWICESITCLVCASQSGKIITIEDFKKAQINNNIS